MATKNKKKLSPKKSVAPKKTQTASVDKTRRLKTPKYKAFKLSKKINVETHKTLPKSSKLLIQSFAFFKTHWRIMGGIAAVYLGLNIILVHGLSSVNLDDVIFDIENASTVPVSGVSLGLSLFGYLLSSSGGATTERGSTYQNILLILVSMIVIWTIRQIMANKKPTVKESFYRGTGPFIPFVLVLLVVGVQLIPLVIGAWIYGNIVGGGIAISVLEKVIWGIVFFLFSLLSLYLASSSVFALYIVNLPGVTPLQALRSARILVKNRRFQIMRKVLYLPFMLIIIGAVLMVPVLMLSPIIAVWLYMILSASALVIVHIYMYSLYRSLL